MSHVRDLSSRWLLSPMKNNLGDRSSQGYFLDASRIRPAASLMDGASGARASGEFLPDMVWWEIEERRVSTNVQSGTATVPVSCGFLYARNRGASEGSNDALYGRVFGRRNPCDGWSQVVMTKSQSGMSNSSATLCSIRTTCMFLVVGPKRPSSAASLPARKTQNSPIARRFSGNLFVSHRQSLSIMARLIPVASQGRNSRSMRDRSSGNCARQLPTVIFPVEVAMNKHHPTASAQMVPLIVGEPTPLAFSLQPSYSHPRPILHTQK